MNTPNITDLDQVMWLRHEVERRDKQIAEMERILAAVLHRNEMLVEVAKEVVKVSELTINFSAFGVLKMAQDALEWMPEKND